MRHAGRPIRAAVLAELDRVRDRDRRSAADGQAGAPRELGRDDPGPRSIRARRGARHGVPLRHAGAGRDATCAGARDLEVSVIGNGPADLELYGPGEIISGHEFYDYAAKYTPGLSETSTRAEVTDRQRPTIQKIARDAYRAIGAEGFARVDFLLAGDTIILSEINTIPGFTPISLFPTMPAEGGYTFGAVCARIVELAIERHAGRAGRRLTVGGPAAMNGRPVARRTSRATAPGAGRGRSAGHRPASRRRAPARPSRCCCRQRRSTAWVPRPPSTTGRSRSWAPATPIRAPSRRPSRSARGENLFLLSTTPLLTALESLPTVRAAHVDVRLPETLAVSIDERVPVLVWQVGDRRYLADSDGTLFALMPAQPPADAAALPVIDDRRVESINLDVGKRLDPVDLDAATRLASLVPADIGSAAVSLGVSVTDANGFVVTTRPSGWSAVFGFYTPSLRTTGLIPGQVRLLRSLLVGREAEVQRVILASGTDGTYTPRATPSRHHRPSRARRGELAERVAVG